MHHFPGQHVANRKDANGQRTVETAHRGDKENGPMNRIHARILKRLNVRRARPTHLLQEPAYQRLRRIGQSQGLRVERYLPAIEEQLRRQVAVLVDDGLDAKRGLRVPGKQDGLQREQLERCAGSGLAIHRIHGARLASRDGELRPVGCRAQAGNRAVVFIVDGEGAAAAADELVGGHAADGQKEGVGEDERVGIAGPQVFDVGGAAEGEGEDEVGEHDVFLADVRLVDADWAEALAIEVEEIVGFEGVESYGIDFLHGELARFFFDGFWETVKILLAQLTVTLFVFCCFQPFGGISCCEPYS